MMRVTYEVTLEFADDGGSIPTAERLDEILSESPGWRSEPNVVNAEVLIVGAGR